jgi:hypothetical protein
VSHEDGRATVVLGTWAGALEIEAELRGGATARGTARMDGPRDVHLVTFGRLGASPARPAILRPALSRVFAA